MTLGEIIQPTNSSLIIATDGMGLNQNLEPAEVLKLYKITDYLGMIASGIGNFAADLYERIVEDPNILKYRESRTLIAYIAGEKFLPLKNEHMRPRIEDAKMLNQPLGSGFELNLAFGALEPKGKGYQAKIFYVASNGEVITPTNSITDKCLCIGNGTPYAKGILEEWLENYVRRTPEPPYFKVVMPLSTAQLSAIVGLVKASQSTRAVDKPFFMATITKDGWQWVNKKEIERLERHAKDYLKRQKALLKQFIKLELPI